MKKIIAVLSAVVLLCGCTARITDPSTSVSTNATGNETTKPSTIPTTVPSTPIVSQLPMYAVSLPVLEENVTADDGTIIFQNSYRNMSLVIPDQEVADKIIIDYLGRTDTTDRRSAIVEDARNAHSHGITNALPYHLTTNYVPTRIDQSVLSLFGNVIEYTGGAHGNDIACSVTYDMTTGSVLTWQDILCDNVTPDLFSNLILNALSDSDSVLFEGYEQTVKDIYGKEFPGSNEWYLDADGLCCYFSPYTIGPYASGTITARVPYGSLAGVLQDAYFPREQDQYDGALEISSFDENKLSTFSQITELTLTTDGDMYILYTDGLISNICISEMISTHEASSYPLLNTVFAASTLTPGDAIVINTDRLSDLSVTYTIGEEQVTQNLG